MTSRKFKENFIVGGCFALSLLAFILVLAAFHPWWLLPAFLMGWGFVLIQSIRMGIWKRRPPPEDRQDRSGKNS